eukprot:GHVR01141117.1.p1 GENE.GHVR01141117.1~~GHVR01141117.1.p1  ORF type:complete len:222 (+),score=72.33 GHVR01141117.1:185-850(+)
MYTTNNNNILKDISILKSKVRWYKYQESETHWRIFSLSDDERFLQWSKGDTDVYRSVPVSSFTSIRMKQSRDLKFKTQQRVKWHCIGLGYNRGNSKKSMEIDLCLKNRSEFESCWRALDALVCRVTGASRSEPPKQEGDGSMETQTQQVTHTQVTHTQPQKKDISDKKEIISGCEGGKMDTDCGMMDTNTHTHTHVLKTHPHTHTRVRINFIIFLIFNYPI